MVLLLGPGSWAILAFIYMVYQNADDQTANGTTPSPDPKAGNAGGKNAYGGGTSFN